MRACGFVFSCLSILLLGCGEDQRAPVAPYLEGRRGHEADSGGRDSHDEAGTEATADAGADRDAGGAGDAGASHSDPTRGSSAFDPGRVYLLDALSPGQCNTDTIAAAESRGRALIGFDCYYDKRKTVIHPITKRLTYYMSTDNEVNGGVREFVCDADCRFWDEDFEYPSDPEDNDPELPVPSCERRLADFWIAPDGFAAYGCSGTDGIILGQDGERLYTGSLSISHLGNGRLAYAETHLVDLNDGTEIPIVGLPALSYPAVRATQTGFWLTVTPGDEATGPSELWEVAPDGTSRQIGSYRAPPSGYERGFGRALDADGRLYELGRTIDMPFTRVLIRSTLDGASDVIFRDGDSDFVPLYEPMFVSGP